MPAAEATHEQDRQTIAANLKRLRKERNFTQAQLGLLSGISPHHISEYENARHVPRPHNLRKLAKQLGVQWWELRVPHDA